MNIAPVSSLSVRCNKEVKTNAVSLKTINKDPMINLQSGVLFLNCANYFPNISFGNSDISSKKSNEKIFFEMKDIVKKKNFNFSQLNDLFLQTTDKIQDNVYYIVDKFEDNGLTFESYLSACAKYPKIIVRDCCEIEKRIYSMVDKFKDNGLTLESYLKAFLNQPQILCVTPDTIEKNVKDLVKKFEKDGLTLEQYLQICLQMPSLFCNNPDTIAQKVEAYQYCDLFDNKKREITDIIQSEKLTYSASLIFLQNIIYPQIKKELRKTSIVTSGGIKPKLKQYFRENPKSYFTINIPNTPMAKDFIKIIQEWCIEELYKDDVFVYKLVNPNKNCD